MTFKRPSPEEQERAMQRNIQRIRGSRYPGPFALCLLSSDTGSIIRKSSYPEAGMKGMLNFYADDVDHLVEKLRGYQGKKNQETLLVKRYLSGWVIIPESATRGITVNSFTIEHSEIEQVVALLEIADKHYKNEERKVK